MTRDEAINTIRNIYHTSEEIEALQTLIPELAESEDERIRKEIINYIVDKADQVDEVTERRWIAYLEKQKDKNCLACDQHLKGYIAGRKATEEEKQKPIQSESEREYVRTLKSLISDFLRGKDEVDREYYQQIYDWLDGRHIEPKPVEIKIDNPNIQKFDPDVKVTTSDSSADGKELLYVSNKSYDIGFRDGVNSVKPVEWSEEDEKRIQRICDFLWKNRKGDTDTIYQIEKDADWLKSLRPSWKPSEEQMEALRKVVNKLANTEVADSVRLSIMYDHLKKLM